MRNLNLSGVSENNRIEAGGYIAVITRVEDVPLGSNQQRPDKGDYLKIEFDIAEGPMTGYYGDMFNSLGFWGGILIRSYKQSALSMFKGFINQVKNSNPGFIWNEDAENDEQTLVGKFIGVVLAEEEYRGNDGSLKTRIRCDKTKTVADIKAGKFKVPDLKKLESANRSAEVVDSTKSAQETMEEVDGEVPF